MDKILTDLSPDALANAIMENCYDLTPFSHGWKGAETYSGDGVDWVLTDLHFPPCNAAFHTNLKPEDADKTIEKFKERGKAKKVPLQWYIGPETRPADIGEKLKAHGFTTRGDGAGMAIDLHNMNENEPIPEGLEIIEAKDEETLKEWCHIVRVAFGPPPEIEPIFLELMQRYIKYNQPVKYYLGLVDGQPASTSGYFLAAGVVGIYFVATLPEFRKRGAAFAVTQKALKDGRELGYRVGILQASNMGEPVYKRMGFKEYCRVGSYEWFPEGMRKE
ncbi:MAG: GNAT family N-acetyltransferase [Dehalococcoidales bacterium]|nr:GNAT family N-acetyltransferase [Dehalococcoidales bacterium]